MQAIIKPGNIQGTVQLPASKSMMQRVCACALLHIGKTIITNPGNSKDDKAAISIIQKLGATVDCTDEHTIEINSSGVHSQSATIDCTESGLSARLFIPVAALSSKGIAITGSGSLLQRPMTEYIKLLPELGVSVIAAGEYLPMSVEGPLTPKNITLDGSMSSQFLSGLLIAFAFSATEPVNIHVNNLVSKPYVDMTLQVLQKFGKFVQHYNYESFSIIPAPDNNRNIHVTIEADWSAAANFIVARAIAGADINIPGLNYQSTQADKAIGQIVTDTNDAFDFDATDCPDLFPVLSVYAACCHGESSITGLHRLLHKESNRIETIMTMLDSLGITYLVEDDTLTIQGNQSFNGCTVNGYNDHRIVMAAAVAAITAKGPLTILGAEAVNKSYPDFFHTLSSIGVNCKLEA
ncbi:MAG: 3-phosphoshikimate 1-carboxyvinyltransferase [Chitinophagales bacterium]|nr:3-phosphoshikimate 1-carboxyvinyltransferase [Chitinophagales bacterium]